MTKESVNEQRPSTLYFNWISRLKYLKIFELFCFSLKHKGFLSSPNKKVVLSLSFLNFLRIFCKLKEQFLRVWENFAPPPGIRPSFFARVAGIRSLKKIFPVVARGDVPSWNRLRHNVEIKYYLKAKRN